MRNIINYSLSIIFTLCLTGCERTKQQDDRWDGKEFDLTSEVVRSDREILKFSPIVIFKDYLVINSNEKGKFFSLFEISGDSIRYVNGFLGIGRGPQEVTYSAYGHYMPEEDLFCIVSNPRIKNMFVPLGDPNNLFDTRSWRIFETNLTGSSIEAIPVDSSSMLVLTAGENDRMFAVMDTNNNTIEDIDIVIPDKVNAPSAEKLMSIYLGRVRKRPNHDQFAYSPQQGNLVKVFELADKKVGNSFYIFDELPKYYYDGNRIRREGTNKSGFRLEVTEKYLYIGDQKLTDANEDRAKEINGYRSGYMKEIYVSDWDGNPVVKYMLDVPIVYYAIDKNDDYLYAFSYDENTLTDRLMRFKLPDLKK